MRTLRGVLSAAERLYERNAHDGLRHFDLDWPNIRRAVI